MSPPSNNVVPLGSDFLLYVAPDGAVKVRVLFKDESVWLTQKALAELLPGLLSGELCVATAARAVEHVP